MHCFIRIVSLLPDSKYSKILNTILFLFSYKMLVIRSGIHKMLARVANRKDHDQMVSQKQSDLGLHCLSWLFGRQIVFEILEHLLYFMLVK